VRLVDNDGFEMRGRPLLEPGRVQRLYARHDYWVGETCLAAGLFSRRDNSRGASQFVERLGEQLVAVSEKQRWSFREPGLNHGCGDYSFPSYDCGHAKKPVVLTPALERPINGFFLVGAQLHLIHAEFREPVFG
jgi:hypothetical protein